MFNNFKKENDTQKLRHILHIRYCCWSSKNYEQAILPYSRHIVSELRYVRLCRKQLAHWNFTSWVQKRKLFSRMMWKSTDVFSDVGAKTSKYKLKVYTWLQMCISHITANMNKFTYCEHKCSTLIAYTPKITIVYTAFFQYTCVHY